MGLITEDEGFTRLDREVVDVCKAIQDMIDEAAEKAAEEAVEKNSADNIRRFIKATGWTIEQILDTLELSESVRAEVAKLLEADLVQI